MSMIRLVIASVFVPRLCAGSKTLWKGAGFIALLLIAANVSIGAISENKPSTGNTISTNILDLEVDNSAWFNGTSTPVASWSFTDLTVEKFFNFTSIKPGDWEEDTISLHVEGDPAWACMSITLTKDDDASCTEPETLAESACAEPNNNLWDGELSEHIETLFWADDGDNVLEENERVFWQGTFADFNASTTIIALADAGTNVWGATSTPLGTTTPYYIGKAWCLGTLTQTPSAAGTGVSPSLNPGISCTSSGNKNEIQTDILMADLSFSAEQWKNNPSFLCNP